MTQHAQSGPSKREAIAIFEGGGPKGLLHPGAIAAIEPHVDFRVLAGTSAGAIIAGLVAAGYTGREILGTDANGQVSGLLAPSTASFFNRHEWWRLKLVIFIATIAHRLQRGLAMKCISLLTGAVAVYFSAQPILHALAGVNDNNQSAIQFRIAWGVVALSAAFLSWALWPLISRKGYLSTKSFEGQYNSWLRDALQQKSQRKANLAASHSVTFSDIHEFTGRHLHIVAQRVHDRSTQIFSSADESTKHLSVSKCVMASMAIPLIFRPVEIKSRLHIDGGACSNFPAWTVSKHIVRPDPLTPVIGFRITGGESSLTSSFSNYCVALFRALVYGDGRADSLGVHGLQEIWLRPPDGVTAYNLDVTTEQKMQMLAVGESSARKSLATITRHKPRASLEKTCRDMHDHFQKHVFGVPVRSCIYLPATINDRPCLLPMCHIGCEDLDCEEELIFKLREGMTAEERIANNDNSEGECGLCWDQRAILVTDRRSTKPRAGVPFPKKLWKLAKKPLGCVLCVPMAKAEDWEDSRESVSVKKDGRISAIFYVDVSSRHSVDVEAIKLRVNSDLNRSTIKLFSDVISASWH